MRLLLLFAAAASLASLIHNSKVLQHVVFQQHQEEELRKHKAKLPPTTRKKKEDTTADALLVVTKKKHLILHLGPPKTGTTSLQYALAHHAAQPWLLKDGFVYLGMLPRQLFKDNRGFGFPEDLVVVLETNQTRADRGSNLSSLTTSFGTKLTELFKRDDVQGALIISEHLRELEQNEVEVLSRQTKELSWDVRIVVAYRPLYSLLPSMYSQLYRPKQGNRFGFVATLYWPGEEIPKEELLNDTESVGHNSVEQHATTTGLTIPPFALDDRGFFSEKFQAMERTGMHPVATALRYWKGTTPYTVIDLEREVWSESSSKDGNAYLVHLLCRVLPELIQQQRNETQSSLQRAATAAPPLPPLSESCQAAQRGDLTYKNKAWNPAFPINYDILATTAYRKGWIGKKNVDRRQGDAFPTRSEVVRKIAQLQEGRLGLSHRDFPLKCVNDTTLERIYKVSWQAELSVFPQRSHSEQQPHRVGFEQSREKFCNVDAGKVLQPNSPFSRLLKFL